MQRDRSFWIGVTAGLIVQQLVTALIVRKVAYRPARDTTAAVRSRRSTEMSTRDPKALLKGLDEPDLAALLADLREEGTRQAARYVRDLTKDQILDEISKEDSTKVAEAVMREYFGTTPVTTPRVSRRATPIPTPTVVPPLDAEVTPVPPAHTAGTTPAPAAPTVPAPKPSNRSIKEMANDIVARKRADKKEN